MNCANLFILESCQCHISVNIGALKLEVEDKNKYLGIILDEKLTFVNHVNYISSAVSNRIHILKKIRIYIDENTTLLLYKTMILSYYDIGDIFYS